LEREFKNPGTVLSDYIIEDLKKFIDNIEKIENLRKKHLN
jgi:hypothetical protein